MPYQIKPQADEPIIIVSMSDPFDFIEDVRPMIEQIAVAATPFTGNYYVIYEFPNLTVTFSDVVMTLAQQSSKLPGSISDPRVRALAVAPPDMMEFAVKSLEQTQYGKLRMEILPSMEEALEYARLMMTIM